MLAPMKLWTFANTLRPSLFSAPINIRQCWIHIDTSPGTGGLCTSYRPSEHEFPCRPIVAAVHNNTGSVRLLVISKYEQF